MTKRDSTKALSWFLNFLVFCFFLHGCASLPSKREGRLGYREIGLASWYGKDFHGRPTSSGEIYDMFGLTAAHRTLPLGVFLHVTDRRTGKSVDVKVNDRGPFVGDRILDLSYGAAKVLGIIQEGMTEVEIKVVGREPILTGIERAPFIVQVASYQEKENALKTKEKIGHYYRKVYLETYESNTHQFYRVRVGPFNSDSEARSAARNISNQVSSELKVEPIVVRGD